MNEENIMATDPVGNTENAAGTRPPELGKFKSADALLRAYNELEAEFTRRSQRLKVLEEAQSAAQTAEALYGAVTRNEEVRARIVNEYLDAQRGVPLLGGEGAGVTAPALRPKNLMEAGQLALGYFRQHK